MAGARSLLDFLEGASGAGMSAMSFKALSEACFTGDTPVRTEGGAVRADQVTVGTRLLSRDEYDVEGAVEAREVEAVFAREALVTALDAGGRRVRSTAEHPFFVRGKGWTPLNQIKAGDHIATEAGDWVTVDAVAETGEWHPVYNFRVAGHHTYFVGNEEWGWALWAHNRYSKEAGEGLRKRLDAAVEGGVLDRASADRIYAQGDGPGVDTTLGDAWADTWRWGPGSEAHKVSGTPQAQLAAVDQVAQQRLPTNPDYNPGPWNQPGVVEQNNCYAYAANDLAFPRPVGAYGPGDHFPHPGERAGRGSPASR